MLSKGRNTDRTLLNIPIRNWKGLQKIYICTGAIILVQSTIFPHGCLNTNSQGLWPGLWTLICPQKFSCERSKNQPCGNGKPLVFMEDRKAGIGQTGYGVF